MKRRKSGYRPTSRWIKERIAILESLGWSEEEFSVDLWLNVIEKMYHVEGLSFQCIADRCGLTAPSYRNDFKRYHIKRRQKGHNTGDLYGKLMRVQLVDFLRPEMRFDGLDALRGQIDLDCRQAREILAGRAGSALTAAPAAPPREPDSPE